MQQRQMTLINDWQIFVGHCPNLNKDYADHSGVAYSRLNKSVRVPEVERKKMFFQQNTGNTTQRNNLLIIISTKPQMGFSRVYLKIFAISSDHIKLIEQVDYMLCKEINFWIFSNYT